MTDRRVAEAWWNAGEAIENLATVLWRLHWQGTSFGTPDVVVLQSRAELAESHADRALELLAEVEAERKAEADQWCPKCHGSGFIEHTQVVAVDDCPRCSGTGKRGGGG